MRDFKFEIEKAKKDVIESKRLTYKKENDNREPEISEITPKAWFIDQWDTGFVVCDYEELRKVPKRRREKILALGGIKWKF